MAKKRKRAVKAPAAARSQSANAPEQPIDVDFAEVASSDEEVTDERLPVTLPDAMAGLSVDEATEPGLPEPFGGGPAELEEPPGTPDRDAEERGLVRHDPLTAYMQEIRRYPLLSREEEHKLATQYFQHEDVNAARRLIESNLRLVVKIAHEYSRAHRNLLDLIQEGNMGLMQAVKKYDPYRGVKLSSYAAWWIRAYILKFILSNWRLVKLGTTQAQRKLFFNLKKEQDKLEQEGFSAEPRLLAKRLDVSEQEVSEMQARMRGGELSLDAPANRDEQDGARNVDRVAGGSRPDQEVESKEFSTLLRELLLRFGEELEGREKTLFDERMLNDSPLTLQEVGEKYKISRERARQIEARLKTRLEHYLREKLGDNIDFAMQEGE